jgi:putative RNA 2'-phosphotransferase
MDDRRVSRFLAMVLRHRPEAVGLSLDESGWVPVAQLLDALRRHGRGLSRDDLERVVERNDKQRFAFDPTGQRIRANQGHSVPVDLGLDPVDPPAELFHGTADRNVAVILRDGLRKMARHHVHLSPDTQTATKVGQRHGKPVIFAIDSAAMYARGHQFYCSANGVWLTDRVPPEYLRELGGERRTGGRA